MEKTMDKKTVISIACFNKVEYTKKCIDSILLNTQMTDAVLLITDNNSTDGTSSYLKTLQEEYPNQINILKQKTNTGFGHAHNQALQYIPTLKKEMKCDVDFFVVMNNDIVINEENWLGKMKAPFLVNEKMAIVGIQGVCNGLDHGGGGIFNPQLQQPEYIEGSLLIMPVNLLKKHKLFDESLVFAYYEDSDLSLRYRKLGYNIKSEKLDIVHERAVTAKSIDSNELDLLGYKAKNKIRFQKKWAHYLRTKSFAEKILLIRKGAMGDVLMLNPIINKLQEENAFIDITVYTKTPQIFVERRDIKVVSDDASMNKMIRDNEFTTIFNLDSVYENSPEKHIVDAYAEHCNLKLIKKDLKFNIFKALLPPNIEEIIKDKKIAIVNPGKNVQPHWVGRMWEANKFDEVCLWLKEKGYFVVAIGETVTSKLNNIDLELYSKIDIHQANTLIGKAKLFVGIDSFPFHLAQIQDVPSAVFFGSVLPEYRIISNKTYPVSNNTLNCIGCHHWLSSPRYNTTECVRDEEKERCITGVTVEMFKNKIEEIEVKERINK
jgi:GT2 family glycosyltransferase